MTRKSSDAELQARVQIHKTHATAEAIAKVISEIAKWGAVAFIFWQVAPALMIAAETWAGKETVARLSFEWILNEHAGQLLGLIFGGSGILYGYKQSQLRKDAIERLHKYQLKYELEIDPGRTSSNLTPTGETRTEDA